MVAAGQGTRLGAGRPKALVPLGRGRHEAPVVVHALRAALGSSSITHVVVVAPPDDEGMQQLTAAVDGAFPAADGRSSRDSSTGDRTGLVHAPDARLVEIRVVPGGAERSDSVALGLRALAPDVEVVLVHDAARALTPPKVFDRVVAAVRDGHPAVTPALPVADTIKQVEVGPDGTETVLSTIDRGTLRAVQTPQGFQRTTLELAHAEVGRALTDDCGMVEALGGRVHVVPGDPRAMKITTPHDLEVAAAWLEPPS